MNDVGSTVFHCTQVMKQQSKERRKGDIRKKIGLKTNEKNDNLALNREETKRVYKQKWRREKNNEGQRVVVIRLYYYCNRIATLGTVQMRES